jgi:hypothetical protein
VFLKKKTAGNASGGYEWENDGDVIEVPDRVGEELLARKDGEFEEADPPKDHKPSDDAKSERLHREVAERQALKARQRNESPSGTRLNDGRWAQTDTKGDETVDTGLRDTGAEMAPANVMTGPGHPQATVTPGSSENKPTTAPGAAGAHPAADEVQRGTERHETPAADQRPDASKDNGKDNGKDDERKPAQGGIAAGAQSKPQTTPAGGATNQKK